MSMVKHDAVSETTPAQPYTSEQRVGELLRTLRSERHLSVRTLATRAGCSPSFISQIEHGQASPSISSLEKIAMALGVSLSDFFGRVAAEEPAVVRASQRRDLTSAWSRAQLELLTPVGPSSGFESMMLTLAPGGRSGAHRLAHAGKEFAIVFDGEVTLTLGEATYQLGRGDAVTFLAETPHHWENQGTVPARIVLVTTR